MSHFRFLNLPRAMLLAMALALGLCGPARSAGFDLDALMARLAQVQSGEATFMEERHVAQLEHPLHSSGRLRFAAPDTFVRETLEPRPERMAVVGNRVTLSQGNRSRSLMLDSTPEAAVMVEAIRGTLTGNRALLEHYFTTRLQGDAGQWTLELVPREPRLRAQVAQLRVSGQGAQLREVQVTLADGDRSVMHIEPLVKAP